jgi:hypothetical protein
MPQLRGNEPILGLNTEVNMPCLIIRGKANTPGEGQFHLSSIAI